MVVSWRGPHLDLLYFSQRTSLVNRVTGMKLYHHFLQWKETVNLQWQFQVNFLCGNISAPCIQLELLHWKLWISTNMYHQYAWRNLLSHSVVGIQTILLDHHQDIIQVDADLLHTLANKRGRIKVVFCLLSEIISRLYMKLRIAINIAHNNSV